MKIATPTHFGPHLAPAIAFTGLCTVLGIAGIAARTSQVPSTELPSIAMADPIQPVYVADTAQARQALAPLPPSNQLLFTFSAGAGQWVRLMDLDDADAIAHGKRRLYNDNETATVAKVKPADLPARFRDWNGEAISVYETPDGVCTAHVTGFAVVTRLVGDTAYAGLDTNTWTVDSAADKGSAVLAARIEGCKPGLFARQARFAPIIVPTELPVDDTLARNARAALLASPAANEARLEYQDYQRQPELAKTSWLDQLELDIKAVRHPKTGVTWVVVHTTGSHECGGFDPNIVAVFELQPDGTLTTVAARKMDSIYAIEKLIDVDDDGSLELFGNDWLGISKILAEPDGESIDSLAMPFHGCPC